MNIQQVPADGNLHNVTARVDHVGDTDKNKNGTPYQKLTLDGEKVTLYTSKSGPLNYKEATGETMNFKVSRKGKYLNAFLDGVPNKPAPHQTKKKNGESIEMTRSVCLSYAKDLVVSGSLVRQDMFTEAERMVNFVTTGSTAGPTRIANDPDMDYSQEPDDIPF